MTVVGFAFDLKDSRHRDTASARVVEDWLDACTLEGKASATILNQETTVARLLRMFPATGPLERDDFLWYLRPGGTERRRHRFADRRRELGISPFNVWWHRCLVDAEVEPRHPHMARHTFATRWIRQNLPIETLSLVLGHESIQTTLAQYVHLDDTDSTRDMLLLRLRDS